MNYHWDNLDGTPLTRDMFDEALIEMKKQKLNIEPQTILIPAVLYELLSEYGDPETIIREICKEHNIKIYNDCLDKFNKGERYV